MTITIYDREGKVCSSYTPDDMVVAITFKDDAERSHIANLLQSMEPKEGKRCLLVSDDTISKEITTQIGQNEIK